MAPYIAIEGCMGAGKTTLARELAKVIGAALLLEESGRHPFIRDFYEAPEAYAVETEITFVLLHYHQIVKSKRSGLFEGAVVSDFALERDRLFAKLTLRESHDAELFNSVYLSLKERLPLVDVLIFLRAPTAFLLERMAKRGRDYERKISADYVHRVNSTLESFFAHEYSGRVIALDAVDLDVSRDPNYVRTVATYLDRPGVI